MAVGELKSYDDKDLAWLIATYKEALGNWRKALETFNVNDVSAANRYLRKADLLKSQVIDRYNQCYAGGAATKY